LVLIILPAQKKTIPIRWGKCIFVEALRGREVTWTIAEAVIASADPTPARHS
jgi:hypothetical protein